MGFLGGGGGYCGERGGCSMVVFLWFFGVVFGFWYWSWWLWLVVGSFVVVCFRLVVLKILVGFIGLGNMGNLMVKNFMKYGYLFIIYDVFFDVCKEF